MFGDAFAQEECRKVIGEVVAVMGPEIVCLD